MLVNQPTPTPTRKAAAVMIGGGASTALSVVLGYVLSSAGLHIPAEVQVAAASLAMSVLAYLTRDHAHGDDTQ